MTPYTLPMKSQLPAIHRDKPRTMTWWVRKAAVARTAVRAMAGGVDEFTLDRAARTTKGARRSIG